jgi:hypothetical protein
MAEQFHSSSVKDRNKPLSESSIQTSFYYEARRLWDLEESRDSLTKVQAGMILCKCTILLIDVKIHIVFQSVMCADMRFL